VWHVSLWLHVTIGTTAACCVGMARAAGAASRLPVMQLLPRQQATDSLMLHCQSS
jgi:hypothetical protein